MTFDDLKEWPLFHTRVACADGKFGVLHSLDDETTEAVVSVFGERSMRMIHARDLEPGDHETLVQLRSAQ